MSSYKNTFSFVSVTFGGYRIASDLTTSDSRYALRLLSARVASLEFSASYQKPRPF